MIGRNSFNRISSLIRKWEGALWLAGAVGVVLIGGILSEPVPEVEIADRGSR